jgi:hypothetical protein
VDAARPDGAVVREGRVRLAVRCDAGLSRVPITAATARAATPSASKLEPKDMRLSRRSAPRAGRRMDAGRRSPARGGTRPTGGASRSRAPAGGAWTASCSAAESSLQNASAACGTSSSRGRCAARVLAADPIGTSSSGGPTQSRGSRMTFSSLRGSPPLSSVRPSPVSTGFADLSSVRVPLRLRGEVQYNPELAPVCLNW